MVLQDLWAKTNPFENVESHILRVGLVCKVAINKTSLKGVYECLKNCIVVQNEKDFQNFLCYIISMHDIGKISPFFQAKEKNMEERLKQEELYQETVGEKFQHEAQSADFLCQYLIEKYQITDIELVEALCNIVGNHHDRLNSKKGKSKKIKKNPQVWESFRNEMEEKVYNTFSFKTIGFSEVKNKDIFYYYLWGLMIICDWIASNENMIKSPIYSIDNLLNDDTDLLRFICSLGFGYVEHNWKQYDFSKLLGVPNVSLRPIQNWMQKFLNENSFDLMMIEAGTGEGKTSLSLYAALNMLKSNEGFYIALPMQVMVNEKYFELKKVLDKDINLTLLHSSRIFMDNLEDDFSYYDQYLGDSVDVSKYLTNSMRRGLFNQCIVGTIDQIIGSVIPNRFNVLKLIGLTGKCIILDEIHAYDSYTSAIILRFLTWCKALNIRVILMSATLPKKLKEKYLKAYIGQDVIIKNEGYPLITVIDKDMLSEYKIQGSGVNKKIDIEVLENLNDLNSQVERIKEIYEKDNNVVVFKNTVKSAQELFRLLKCKISDSDILLCHSSFTLKDRHEKEALVCNLFGKNFSKRPKKYIVVCTQVFEACMDIDFDVCFTDIAPIDILIQRWGRMCRFSNAPESSMRGRSYIMTDLSNNFGSISMIYPEIFLRKTNMFLKSKLFLMLPDELRMGIEEVYSNISFTDSELLNLFMKYSVESNLKENNGFINTLDPPNDIKYTAVCKNYIVTDDEDDKYIGTRLILDSHRVLCLDTQGLKLLNEYKVTEKLSVLKQLMQYSLTVSYIGDLMNKDEYQEKNYRFLKGFLVFDMSDGEIDIRNDKFAFFRYDSDIGFEKVKK